ncbi:MAG: hypothetical protein ACI4J2_00985 [Ruminococcus sp.]
MKNRIRVSVWGQLLIIFILITAPVIIRVISRSDGSREALPEPASVTVTTTAVTSLSSFSGTSTSAETTITTTVTATEAPETEPAVTESSAEAPVPEPESPETEEMPASEEIPAEITEYDSEEVPEGEQTIEDSGEVTPEMQHLGSLRITGYVSTGSPTASGEMPYVGGVAVNSSFMSDYGLEYGDTVYIDGMGWYTLNDTGCQYGVVDVFCGTTEECYAITSYADVYYVP